MMSQRCCMNRLLCEECDCTTDLATISEELEKLRKQHKGLLGEQNVPRYERHYPDFPVFFAHCNESDTGEGERVQMEMMRGVSKAMSRPIPYFSNRGL